LSLGVLGLESGCTTEPIEEGSMIFVGDDWAEDHHDVHVMLHDKKGQANAANNLGVALCSLRLFEPGIKYLSEALKYFEDSGQEGQAARTRWHLERATLAASTQKPSPATG
jgi:hypothetical protein